MLIDVYVFDPSSFHAAPQNRPSRKNEREVTDAIQVQVNQKCKVEVEQLLRWWKYRAKLEDMLEAYHLVLSDTRSSLEVEIPGEGNHVGNVSLGHISRIEVKASIHGPAIIAQDSRIRPNIFVFPCVSIDEYYSLKNAGIENSIVMMETSTESNKRITYDPIDLHNITPNAIDRPRGHKMVVVGRSLCSYLKTLESGFGVALSSHTEASKNLEIRVF